MSTLLEMVLYKAFKMLYPQSNKEIQDNDVRKKASEFVW